MKLAVFLLGKRVATLESVGDFKSVLTYDADAGVDDFVSLTMPVRTESWVWDDPLHPIFRMNLPEGYLLHVLEEQFGPIIGASPITLLSVVGRNMVGRLQVAPPDANLAEAVSSLDVAELLAGDNSEPVFSALVRKYAASGVSGVVPKFLDAQKRPRFAQDNKATLYTRRHIVKGSTRNLPFVALNEHLGMQVAAKVTASAQTEVSEDGQALLVHRFDVDEDGSPQFGLEDFCSLLGLRPSAKYETNWERIAKAVRHHVPGPRQRETFQQLAATLLLTYALRNADCHAKNLALLYTTRADVHLAPVYDMLTTSVYADYKDSPPGLSFLGRKTWLPGRSLQNFIASTFGLPPREQVTLLEQISDAVSDTAPLVRATMDRYPGFRELGKHLLKTWFEGVTELRNKRTFALGAWRPNAAFRGFSEPAKLKATKRIIR